jgi:hypothetical protein
VREGLRRTPALAGAILLAAALLWAQNRVDYLNGIAYVFPAMQGATNQDLANDGSGNLSWSNPPSPEGLWSGAIVLSTVACDSGWTRVSAADDRVLRGAATFGGIGGSDTHTHTLSGVLGAATVSITGSTAGSTVSISGSTGTTSISHSHGISSSGTSVQSGSGPTAITSLSISSSDPSHSHGAGSLAGASHTHGAGSLAGASHGHAVGSLTIDSASNLAAYYGLVVCQKD